MDQEIIKEIQKILWYIEEYKGGNDEYLNDMKDICRGIKKNANASLKNYIIFSLLNMYLDLGIKLVNQEIYNDSEYQRLMQYCKSDIKYYLEVSKKLKTYVNDCLKNNNFEDLDIAYTLTIQISYILHSISDYFAHIRNIEKYAQSGIHYQYPKDIREEGKNNIDEIELSLQKLGLRGN